MKHGQFFCILFLLLTKLSFTQVDTFSVPVTDTIEIATETIVITTDTIVEEIIADTIKSPFYKNLWSHEPHSVGKAALYSAVVPGLGQAYNGKYWKIPIVYAGIGTSAYFVYYWNSFYKELRQEYIFRTDGDSTTNATIYNYITSDEILLQYVDNTKRYSDLLVVVTSVVYILNIVDAVVDAHLYDFNVSDDLSLHVQPYILPKGYLTQNDFNTFGLNLKLSLK